MKPSAILALDIGTSSTRSAIYAKGNRVMATTAQISYPLVTDADGRAELGPEDIARAVAAVFEKTLQAWRKIKSPAPIAAIGVSCFWHSLLGLDAESRAITPIYTWADSRCRAEAKQLREKRGEIALHARTGCMARTSFWPAKLLWLRTANPTLFRKVARWISPAEWIQEKWCGASTASLSMASGTGLLDGHTLKWHAPLLRRCGLKANQLNRISDEPLLLTQPNARRIPELAGASWYPAIGDGAASNLGSGVAAINVGTSAALRVVVEREPDTRAALAPFGLFSYLVDAHRRLMGGAVSNAGNLRAWALRELNLPDDFTKIEKLLSTRQLPAEGLTLLPFLIAERAPTWPEELPSAIVGITQATTALDLLQALQEATYLRLAQIGEAVEKASGRKFSFIVSGGIQHSANSMQRLANVLGRPIYASPEPEASLRGAACFAMEKLGLKPPALKLGRAIRPNAVVARAYARALKRQVQLESKLRVILAAAD